MRKLLCMLLCLTLLLPTLPVLSEVATLSIEEPEGTVRPGKAVLLTFSVPAAGECDLLLLDADGSTVQPIVLAQPVSTGVNHLWWNGTYQGAPAPEGSYALTLVQNGVSVSVPVTIGTMAPYITAITARKDAENAVMTVDFYASVSGLLTVGVWAGNAWTLQQNLQISTGSNSITWSAAGMTPDTTAVTLTLTDATGFSSNEEHIAVSPEEFGITYATPAPTETPTATPTAAPTASPTILQLIGCS